MKKALITFLAACALAGCAGKQSAYESGWNNETNEDAYVACAPYRYQHREYQNVLDRVVAKGLLTGAQANRAMDMDVKIGDPECLAYAAYGAEILKTDFFKPKGLLIKKAVTYDCREVSVPCPGLRVEFTDGKVTAIDKL